MYIEILEMTYEELVLRISGPLSKQVRDRCKELLTKYGDRIENVLDTPQMQFLKLQTQHGYKAVMRAIGYGLPITPYKDFLREFSRFFHSKVVAAMCTVSTAVLGYENKKAMTLILAGLLHDLGHGKFGHTCERMLQAIFDDHSTHEERTTLTLLNGEFLSILKTSEAGLHLAIKNSALIRALNEFDLEHDLALNIADVVDEKGELGAVQRLMDSGAWTTHDVLVPGFFGGYDETDAFNFMAKVVGCLRGYRDGKLVVSDTGGIQKVANRRALLFRDWFRSHLSEQTQHGFIAAMRYMFKREWLVVDDIYSMNIHEIDLAHSLLERARQSTGFEAQWVHDLMSMPNALKLPEDRWHVESFVDPVQNEWIQQHVNPHVRPYVILVPLQVGAKLVKKFPVLIDGGSLDVVTVTANKAILDIAKRNDRGFVLVPNFIPA